MKGILYGIGTGPGDPSLITVKALEIIKSCDTIALPSSSKEHCTVYEIIRNIYPDIDSKEFLFLDFPMSKDEDALMCAHESSAEKLIAELEKNRTIAFITIGDVTIYSTFMYVKSIIESKGFETKLINGVPSFCAAAASLGISLSEQDEEIHIIPGSYDLNDSFLMNGTLIYMKSGKKILQLKEFLIKKQESYDFDFHAVSNCGMQDERKHESIMDLSEASPYFTIVIIRNKKRKNSEKHCSFYQNTKCEMFPCHKTNRTEDFNCLFCYCPLYFLGDKCGGNFHYTPNGTKSCINCSFPHERDNYRLVQTRLRELLSQKEK